MRNKPKRKVIKIDGTRYYSDKPGSCARCIYYRPDFKYRKCQFSRCPYGKEENLFRKKSLKCDKFSFYQVPEEIFTRSRFWSSEYHDS